ncbi:methylglyoxal synthase [Cetobacterium ceti]|uniref:Methylglyoxal synthase n=1 Tax=Cetobacterium ceti TaxID=180163 RepID=A0A1T4K1B2_9FUSO|nr:methylglyoxal synthase [Cetobacterium ceti]SJZ36159.1 methylglyoxal synthase [Cetobacterium ceti]
MKKIALIAHDNMKLEMIQFVKDNVKFFSQFELIATGTTGTKIMEATGLTIERYKSGPLGGDQQIGADIATDKIGAVFFFRDALTAQPHEPDIMALIRLADVHKIPMATNSSTAKILLKGLQ